VAHAKSAWEGGPLTLKVNYPKTLSMSKIESEFFWTYDIFWAWDSIKPCLGAMPYP